MIFELLGRPSEEDTMYIQKETDRELLRRLPRREPKSFADMFQGSSPEAIDLIKRMLTFNPQKRITVEQALAHPYLADLHFEEDEPSGEMVSAFDFDFESYDLSKEEYKTLIYDEIMLYHSDEAME